MKNRITIILLSLFVLTLAGCATKKKSVDEVKGLKKALHNLNARFNGYHNAKIILKESFTNLSDQHQDNYNQILALYKEAAVEDAQSVAGPLDEAIKKSSIVISLHRPSKWTDDAYFLIGQAEYLKQNYETASEAFDYIVKEYDPQNLYEKERKRNLRKKKKKKKTRKLKGEELEEELAKKKYNVNSRRNAMIWHARTLVEQGDFDKAFFKLSKMKKDDQFNKKQLAEIAAIDSYYHLKRKDYANSVETLNQAIELTANKRKKTRYVYILAQIHELEGRQDDAAKAYKQVLALRPEYDMEFRTRLNMITNDWASGGSSSKNTLAALKRMSKDIKNEEFRDQIFFSMAQVALKDQQIPDAIEYLKESLVYNQSNRPQKAESYLKLAEIYFNREEYVFSKRYYDSTLLAMPENDLRFDEVTGYANSLTDIAQQIELLALNDSLVMISKMTDEERMVLAKKLKKEQLDNAPDKGKGPARPTSSLPSASAAKSRFFAYDANSVKKGAKEFNKIWGERALEDDWRRSNRGNIAIREEEGVDAEIAAITVSDKEMAAFFKDVPKTPADIEKIEKSNLESLFLLGNLYRDRLENDKKAITTFEDLIKRFPKNKYDLEVAYSLYLLHLESGDRQRAGYFKDLVLKQYPDSKHAKAIKDPASLANVEDTESKLNKYYNGAYDLYETGEYTQAVERINKAEEVFGDGNTFRPKFALLMALCTGNIDGKAAYVSALKQVVRKYPDTDEALKAKEYLSFLGEGTADTPTIPTAEPTQQDKKGLFKIKPDDQHYVIVVLDDENAALDKVKAAISDYNKKYHELENLKISSLMLSVKAESAVLIVRRFANEATALKYLKEVRGKKDEMLGGLDPNADIYPLSQANYKTLLRLRELEPFLEFCEENYE